MRFNMKTLREEMLEAIYIKTGGYDNPMMADICNELAQIRIQKAIHERNALLGKYHRLLGEYQGTIEGIMAQGIPKELYLKLSDVLHQLKLKEIE